MLCLDYYRLVDQVIVLQDSAVTLPPSSTLCIRKGGGMGRVGGVRTGQGRGTEWSVRDVVPSWLAIKTACGSPWQPAVHLPAVRDGAWRQWALAPLQRSAVCRLDSRHRWRSAWTSRLPQVSLASRAHPTQARSAQARELSLGQQSRSRPCSA